MLLVMATANPLPPPRSFLESMTERIANTTPEEDEAMRRVKAVRAIYGQDFEREMADYKAGRHPLQRPRG